MALLSSVTDPDDFFPGSVLYKFSVNLLREVIFVKMYFKKSIHKVNKFLSYSINLTYRYSIYEIKPIAWHLVRENFHTAVPLRKLK
jgi:hypothetical protein